MQKLKAVIDQKIRPILSTHNGDIELLEVTSDGFVRVRLTGACATCPGAKLTITEIVETNLRDACPEINGVIMVSQVSENLIRQALDILRKDKKDRKLED